MREASFCAASPLFASAALPPACFSSLVFSRRPCLCLRHRHRPPPLQRGMAVMLKRCCCHGCPLKTGAIIIGVSGIVYAIVMIIEYLHVMPTTSSELKYKWTFDVQLMSYISLCLGLLTLLMNCILIVGVCTESKGPLLAWTIFTAVVTVLGMALCPLTVEIYFWDNKVNLAIIVLCSGLTGVALNIYYLLVVYSFYRTIGNSSVDDAGVV